MQQTNIYKRTEQHVTDLFLVHHPPHLVLHNLAHTKNVVKKTNEIAGHYQLTEEDMRVLFIAAWFHDSGYLTGPPEGHEERSAELMRSFMTTLDEPESSIEKAAQCILATKFPRNPEGILEEIICDADTYQFGDKKEFKETNREAFEEAQYFSGFAVTKHSFHEGTLALLEKHQFYTSYCRDLLNGTKKEIMKKIKKKLEKETAGAEESEKFQEINEKNGTTKGMQTMLRLTSSNHVQLSEMADSKANILISVNAIIISVILSVLLRKLSTDPYLTIPTILFLAFSVVTIVIAILATRPKLNTGVFDDADVVNKKTNLLFFGNFHKMSLLQYETAMRTMMKDSNYLYSSMIQDIYHLGTVLGKKYRLIRWAYNIFMVGIIVSVIAFSIASVINANSAQPAGITNSTGSPF
jgi:predicted metal-dependent HD superfamily phosphohydrolase